MTVLRGKSSIFVNGREEGRMSALAHRSQRRSPVNSFRRRREEKKFQKSRVPSIVVYVPVIKDSQI